MKHVFANVLDHAGRRFIAIVLLRLLTEREKSKQRSVDSVKWFQVINAQQLNSNNNNRSIYTTEATTKAAVASEATAAVVSTAVASSAVASAAVHYQQQ